ncbi:unnamed protein product [Mytilus coruscus]|uniref:Uncharacterized protein n=1 Tax=Mytilus coruscus TaxID=42192 RepID=A0A6J8C9Z6_MYTCO|nr:unnamed protein product [Mytilus coruscus]
MTQLEEKALLPFHSPCSVLIVGPTQSGKTVLTFKIIKQSKEMFTSPPVKTVYCYSAYQDLFSKKEKEIENISFHEGLPTSDDINAWSENKEHIFLVLDDLLATAVNTELLKSFWNRYIMTREMILIPKQKYEAVLGRREDDENTQKQSLTDNQSQTVPKDNHSESSEKQLLGEKFDTLIDISIPSKYRNKVKRLLHYLKQHSSFVWNERGEVIIDNETFSNTYIIDWLREIIIHNGHKYPTNGICNFYDFKKNACSAKYDYKRETETLAERGETHHCFNRSYTG